MVRRRDPARHGAAHRVRAGPLCTLASGRVLYALAGGTQTLK